MATARDRASRPLIEPLERRALLASPADVLTTAMRQQIIDHWVGPNRATMQAKLDVGPGAFDAHLLRYMLTRPEQSFFWRPADVPEIGRFIAEHLYTQDVIDLADDVVDHRFPNGRSDVYDVQLPPGDFDWTTSNSNPEFVHALNRHEFWRNLSQAYVLTHDAKYIQELVAQLSSWSLQFDDPVEPDASEPDSPWQPLDVALRTETWAWVYQQVLGTPGWSEDANTLFVYELQRHGDFLRRVRPYASTSNRALSEGQGLLMLAQMVPEFDQAGDWESYGRQLMFQAMDAQLLPDGGHAESSPGYASTVILSLLDAYRLDQVKGDEQHWSPSRLARLSGAAAAERQLATPDSQIPAWSDTYRGPIGPFLNRPRIILGDSTTFPAAKPRMADVWMFGPDAVAPMLDAPVDPLLPDRGRTFSMPQSGYYVLRSGDDAQARQITFDAGPTGGSHGHFDLLSFELFGYGRPLISDPGLYNYDTSERRHWVVSTPAHNTISIDGRNHAAVEGVANAALWCSGISHVAGGYQITATHHAYAGLEGSPVVQRSVWYDGDGVMLVVDLAQATAAHVFSGSFLLPGTSYDRDLDAGWVQSLSDGGNVRVQALLQAGQTARVQTQISAGTNVFTSDGPDENIAKDATRFYVTQNSESAAFVTLISAYPGATTPDVSARLSGSAPAGTLRVTLYRDGTASEVIPFFARPGADFRPAAPAPGGSDLVWDDASGRLHLVYYERDQRTLKYSVRGADGRWSMVQTVDDDAGAGLYPSLALDGRGTPAVAYFDGDRGDLKFARLVGGAWQTERIDTRGSTGLYPSLAYHRDGSTAIIAYYRRARGDLRLAAQWKDGWKIRSIDGVGDVGRSPSMELDPNRAPLSRIVIAYDDSTGGAKKLAVQQDDGTWALTVIDAETPGSGGHTSLAFEPTRDARDGLYHAAVSYYDASTTSLRFARQGVGGVWASQTVASAGVQGQYTNLVFDAAAAPSIFYHDATSGSARRATWGGAWTISDLGTGGRELRAARAGDGRIALANVGDDGLRVELLDR
jgi:uncharacterized heparinase superfamily protein